MTATVTACGISGNSGNDIPGLDWENGILIFPGDESGLSTEQQQDLLQDAERLAIRYIHNRDTTEIRIPGNLITHLYNGFVHIASSELSSAIEVTDSLKIHAALPGNPRQLLVEADTAAEWVQAWASGNTQTGNSDIDALTNNYDLEVADYDTTDSGLGQATLQAGEAFNSFAVGRLFREVDQVVNAGPSSGSRRNEINVVFMHDHLRYYYQLNFGNCDSVSGCTSSHSWIFNVYQNGAVAFIGESGDELENL